MGWSSLEHSDPPMGCVTGVFYPHENYARIRETIFKSNRDATKAGRRAKWEELCALNLRVRAQDGAEFQPVGGVSVEDYASELEDKSARELKVFGLPFEVFQRYFGKSSENSL